MEALSPHQVVIASVSGLVVVLLVLLYTSKPWRTKRAHSIISIPEASSARPIIGHLHLLATQVPAHQVLGDMADKYGPIFSLKLGARRVIVVSSWEGTKEVLGTHDRNFLDRPNSAASKYLCYNGALFGFISHGPYWRNMRRISTEELLSNARLDQLKHVRSSELNNSIGHLFSLCENGPAKVNMSECFSRLTMNVMLQMVVGKRYDGSDKTDQEELRQFKRGITEFLELLTKFVMSDVIPFTEWIDFQGHIKRMKRVAKELDRIMSNWMEEHVRKKLEGKVKDNEQDFMDVMLEKIEQYDTLSLGYHPVENVVKGTALNLLLGGMDSTSLALTWALALLLNHSEALRKAQNELDVYVGKERWVEESDIKNMTYIVAIVKETLRLYPVSPLSLQHKAAEGCCLAGKYHVSKDTFMLINIWKLHRDSRVWSDPEEFQPERFLISHAKFDVRGQNFEYIPFGFGRRSCPGVYFATQMTCLTLARVLQGFCFATPDDQSIDMSIGASGLTMPKAIPLEVILTPRLSSQLYHEK